LVGGGEKNVRGGLLPLLLLLVLGGVPIDIRLSVLPREENDRSGV
jgi:hypothetical protein